MREDNRSKKIIPETIGIIMDGNRRFARAKGLPLFKGHAAGFEKLKEFLRWSREAGIRTVIIYAFSTENWNRAKGEVNYLMKLLERMVIDKANELKREKFRVKFIGQLERLPEKIKMAIPKLEEETKHNKETLVVAMSYGGRAEIVEAIKKLSKEKTKDEIAMIDEEDFGKYLWTAGFKDPELIIRTSGEMRTSNFLPWQSVYSEWYFTKTLWPAFTKSEFLKILENFSKRHRRHGK